MARCEKEKDNYKASSKQSHDMLGIAVGDLQGLNVTLLLGLQRIEQGGPLIHIFIVENGLAAFRNDGRINGQFRAFAE